MGLVAIIKSFVFTFLVVGVITLLTPLRKQRWWKAALWILAIGLPLSFFQAHLTLSGYIGSALADLKKNPDHPSAYRFLAGDFIPAKMALFGGIPPMAEKYLEEMAVSDDPCRSAMAMRALGESVDVTEACGEENPL